MKRTFFKKFFSILLTIIMIVPLSVNTMAASMTSDPGDSALPSNSILQFYTKPVPEGAIRHAEASFKDNISFFTKDCELFGIENPESLRLGNAFVIFNRAMEVYIFPILEGDQVRLTLNVDCIGGKWNDSMGTTYANELNQFIHEKDHSTPYLLYYDNGKIIAQNGLYPGRRISRVMKNNETLIFDGVPIYWMETVGLTAK